MLASPPRTSQVRRALHRAHRRVKIAAAFSAADHRLFVEALVTLGVVRSALGVTSFRRVASWVTRLSGVERVPDPQTVDRIVWLVTATGRMLGCLCLVRSMALSRMLARRGVVTELRIGVHTESGVLSAHAWVERDGRVLDDGTDTGRFHRFERPIGNAVHG